MTPEMLYGALLTFVSGVCWYWIRGIDKRQDDDQLRMDRIERDMHEEIRAIRDEYQRRDDAKSNMTMLHSLLTEIKADVRTINEKIDRKADK